jgi:hypothetical protein
VQPSPPRHSPRERQPEPDPERQGKGRRRKAKQGETNVEKKAERKQLEKPDGKGGAGSKSVEPKLIESACANPALTASVELGSQARPILDQRVEPPRWRER